MEQKLQQSKQENKQLTDTQSLLHSKCSALESEVIRKKDLIVSLEVGRGYLILSFIALPMMPSQCVGSDCLVPGEIVFSRKHLLLCLCH